MRQLPGSSLTLTLIVTQLYLCNHHDRGHLCNQSSHTDMPLGMENFMKWNDVAMDHITDHHPHVYIVETGVYYI